MIRQLFAGSLILGLLVLAACAGHKNLTLAEQQKVGFDTLRQSAQAVVQDPQQAAQAVALVEELERILAAAAEDELAFRNRFRELNRNYHAERVLFEDLFEQYNVLIELHQRRVLSVRGELAELLTAEQWAAMDEARKQAMQASLQSL